MKDFVHILNKFVSLLIKLNKDKKYKLYGFKYKGEYYITVVINNLNYKEKYSNEVFPSYEMMGNVKSISFDENKQIYDIIYREDNLNDDIHIEVPLESIMCDSTSEFRYETLLVVKFSYNVINFDKTFYKFDKNFYNYLYDESNKNIMRYNDVFKNGFLKDLIRYVKHNLNECSDKQTYLHQIELLSYVFNNFLKNDYRNSYSLYPNRECLTAEDELQMIQDIDTSRMVDEILTNLGLKVDNNSFFNRPIDL